MNIVEQGKTVKISQKREKELIEMGRTWTQINANLNALKLKDIQRMVYLETQRPKKRPLIIKRLIGRAGTLQRAVDYKACKVA